MKSKLKKLPKVPSYGKLKKKLWSDYFSPYIRQRDKGRCFTCGKTKPWKEMQAGHLFPAGECGIELYFHERNVHCQCYRCNINLGGNGAVYARRVIETYGQDEFDNLFERKGKVKKWPTSKLQELIDHYKVELTKFDDES